ncbi:STAS/SEC14 domain-containing protein [Thermodesulfobacteriota bacterium]
MLEMVDIGIEKAVAYRLEGKITEEEIASVFDIFKEKIEKGEKLIIYQEIVSIGGVEFDAMVEKFKFLIDFGISHFSRIAVVTHKKWLQNLVDIEDKIFKNIDMKGFSTEEKDKAIEFLKST